jgi:4-diphosphocytidyl-2-C-methyl-D-erythritol kinase
MKTPAKINLFLKVTGRCKNSYHTLNTLFMPINDLTDEVEINFDKAKGISINCASSEVPCDENNLCYKAAKKYADFYGINPNWEINIVKNIPVAAGLGGGSSDAAATLLILNEKYQKADEQELALLASQCGADVPFFLNPRPALAKGIGNIFEYPQVNIPEIALLLINPAFPIAASWAYKSLSPDNMGETSENFEKDFLNALQKADLKKLASLIHNDLAIAAYKKFSILEVLKKELLEAGASVAEISGSGPTLFALCETFEKRDTIADVLKQSYPQMTIIKSSLKNTIDHLM